MRKDRVKIRINDGITWNKMKANTSVKGELELRWHYIDEIKWMAMINNKVKTRINDDITWYSNERKIIMLKVKWN